MFETKNSYVEDIRHVTYHLSVKSDISVKWELLYNSIMWTKLNFPYNLVENLSILNVLEIG
jgi:hypothetical protein